MINRFEQDLVIPCYDTDASMYLKPVSFMNYAQEAANIHASELGFGYDDMMAARTVWVLSRAHVRFLRHPKWRDKVGFSTWHKGPERLFYLRDFRMTAEDGEKLILATTSWLVLNIDTRRIVRELIFDEEGICRENAIEPSCGKIQMPVGVNRKMILEHTASYSDFDMNGHVNNAVYIMWAMDVVNKDVSMSHPLKELFINFNHEVKPDDTVALFTAETDGRGEYECYVEGIVLNGEIPERQAFCARLIF